MIMKHLLRTLASVSVLLALASCHKANYSSYWDPKDLDLDPAVVAKTTIHFSQYYSYHDEVATFKSATIYRKSDMEGKSYFIAWSGGKMVYDMFMLSIYFDSIDELKAGDTLYPSRFLFAFPASSDSRAMTHTYEGKITVAAKGVDYVVLQFHNLSLSCYYGDYVTDGYLKCQLCNELVLDN